MMLSPLGDSALVLSWGDALDDGTVAYGRAAAEALRAAAIEGVTDVVPAFSTVTLYYDVRHAGTYAQLVTRVSDVIAAMPGPGGSRATAPLVEIPVCYGGGFGPDLEHVAQTARMSPEAVVATHAGAQYRVHAVGFVPGFAYLGGLPPALHVPRRATPRSSVPTGSVGIGGGQTGVYPMATPGGWNLIGRTPLVLFDPARERPALLTHGDRVRFRPITPEEFVAWK